jgi:threonine dehydrogenase-like Zn-dependent dehydrogenase
VLVTGAGPIGLLATLVGKQRGLERLVTRRERPEDFTHALHREAEDIKVGIQFAKP